MRAVFLDRDGVINEDRDDYVKNVSELKIFPYAPDAVRKLNNAGFIVIVISNQQGVAKGIISEADLSEINKTIENKMNKAGAEISSFFYCTHLSSEECSCRKPQPGLLIQAANKFGFNLNEAIMIGDSYKDILATKAAGCKSILVLTGSSTRANIECWEEKPDYIATDLKDAVEIILFEQN